MGSQVFSPKTCLTVKRLIGSTYDYDDGFMSVGKIVLRSETMIKSGLNDYGSHTDVFW